MPRKERNKKHPEDTLLGENKHGSPRYTDDLGRGTRTAGRSLPLLPNLPVLRKGNPGFLGWLVDPLKGLWSPLLKNIGKALVDTIPFPSLDDFVGFLSAELAAAVPGYGKAGSPAPEDEVEAKYREMRSHAWAAEETAKKILIGSSALSSIPLIEVGNALDECWRLPGVASLMQEATDILFSEYEVGRKPLLERQILRTTTPLLPGYQDMISVYVREGYLAEKWVEIPTKFVENMKELGYSEDWTKQLWGKHWVLPGVELLYDMFHKEIIDYETLALMLKFHDFEPEWRDKLIRNAYVMIPRVDLRRAYMYAIPGYTDLVKPYRKLGYSPEDAVTMDLIAKRWALDAYYSRLLTVARAAYRKGQLPGPDFQAIMEKIHIPQAAQDLVLEAETLARLSGVKDMGEEPYIPSRSDMRWMAEWGEITPEELVELAEADGIDPEWAPRVAEAWLLNQLRDELAKVRRVYEDKLEAGFMSTAAFEKALAELHYPPHIIATLVKWAEEALDLEEKKELAKEYEALAKEGIITVEQYGQALRDLKMVEERITRKMNYVKRLLAIKAAKEAAKKKG